MDFKDLKNKLNFLDKEEIISFLYDNILSRSLEEDYNLEEDIEIVRMSLFYDDLSAMENLLDYEPLVEKELVGVINNFEYVTIGSDDKKLIYKYIYNNFLIRGVIFVEENPQKVGEYVEISKEYYKYLKVIKLIGNTGTDISYN